MGGGGPKGFRSDTGGVIPMNIGGRMVYERERLFGMTDEERAWRAKFVKDQNLSHNEPRVVPEAYEELYNPIRRFYRIPGQKLEKFLVPRVGNVWAEFIRYGLGKGLLGIMTMYYIGYYIKYGGNSWERHGGIRYYASKPMLLPGDEGYPSANINHPGKFYVDEKRGFTDKVSDKL